MISFYVLSIVNLTKYISEVANAVVEAKLSKPADVNKCVQICSTMLQRYPEFTPVLFPPLLRFFGVSKIGTSLKRLADVPIPNLAEDDQAYVPPTHYSPLFDLFSDA
jgi:DNA-binding NarL/FixJ family response regulator